MSMFGIVYWCRSTIKVVHLGMYVQDVKKRVECVHEDEDDHDDDGYS